MSERNETAGEEPTCPRHPSVVTYVRCQRCGRPTCPECQRTAAVGVHCVDCVKEAQKQARPVRSALGFPVSKRRPTVTITLIGLNVATYVVAASVWGGEWVYRLGLTSENWDEEPWRIVTSGFAHVGILHLLINMFVLMQFGGVMEIVLGWWRFLVLYALSLAGGSAMVILLGDAFTTHVGASGAIFGVVAGYAVMTVALKRPAYDLMILAGLWIALGFFVEGFSWQGHLGGAIVGALVTFVLIKSGKRRPTIRRVN
jgi:membrane associated rhomboid family serine protease